MLLCLWTRYRRLTERMLWILCSVACILCLICVFLSLYYLEDHSESFACRGQESKDNTESYKALFKSNSANGLDIENPGSIQEVLAENLEPKRTVNRLANIGPRSLTDRSGRLGSLKERMLKYMQDVSAENIQLKRTIEELANSLNAIPHKARGLPQSWQERSLKYIAGESPQSIRKIFAQGTPLSIHNTFLRCKEISQIEIKEELGRGFTKLTERGVYNGRDVAVKSVGMDSMDLHNCVKEKRAKVVADCMLFSRYKIMKELLLYQQLNHPNVVKLLGYCFQNDQDTEDITSRGLTVVTEVGTPLNLMTVLQMAWHERFGIAVGLARLIKYFSVCPLGSLVIRDFQLIQFVIINNDIKLSDLDDLGNERHSCRSNHDCIIGNQTYNITLPCVNNFCEGYNEKWNLYNLQRFYFKMFLLPGTPKYIAEDLEKIEKRAALLKYDSKDLLRDLEGVLGKLRSGQGLEKYRARYQYKAIPRADFPGYHDYQCNHSMSLVNCQSLAFDEIEAMRQCDADAECKAFVMSYEKTWIGYKLVYFKNNSTGIVFSASNMVYVKVT